MQLFETQVGLGGERKKQNKGKQPEGDHSTVSKWCGVRTQNSQDPCVGDELNLELRTQSRSQKKAEEWYDIKMIKICIK